jgi:hypothetical protein
MGDIFPNLSKVEPIYSRNASFSRKATTIRSFSTSAATLFLTLFRLTSLSRPLNFIVLAGAP